MATRDMHDQKMLKAVQSIASSLKVIEGSVREKEPKVEQRGIYEISLVGCDDETVFEMELTNKEFFLLNRVAEEANKTSTYDCMPKMYVIHQKFIEEVHG